MKNNRISLLLLGIIIGGCAQQSTAPTPAPNAWKNPAIGAQFAWEGSDQDSSQYGVSTGNIQDVFLITDSNLTIGGKTHVNKLIYDGGGIMYTTYEANGDFSTGDSNFNGNNYEIEWTTYPIASGGTITDWPVVDSDIGYGEMLSKSGTRTFVDKETVTIGGTQFQAIKIAENDQDAETGTDYQDGSTQNFVWWFFPEIGFFGKGTGDEFSSSTEYGSYVPSVDHSTSQFELSMYANGAAPESGKSGKPQSVSPNRSSKLLRALIQHSFNKVN